MRSPVQVFLNAVGFSPWIIHDTEQSPPAITLAGFVSSGATLTWGVQYTCDDLSNNANRNVGWSQTTTVITVTDTGPIGGFGNHGLSVGDYVTLFQGPDGGNLGTEYPVTTVVSANQYTLTSVNSRSATGLGSVITARQFPHATLNALTARMTGNYGFPVKGSKLVVTAYTSGVASLEALQGLL